MKSKDTKAKRLKEFKVTVTYDTTIIGTDEADAIDSYHDWLNSFSWNWRITGIEELGDAW